MHERTRKRLEAEVQRELALILEHEVKDPAVREAFATVAEVRLSSDARHAWAYLFVPGDDPQRQAAMAAFERNRGFLRTALAARLKVRRVPELNFRLDDTLDRALRIDEVLKEEADNEP